MSACDDCDDKDAARSPDLTEVTCDEVDNDCDTSTPDAPDGDGDGWSVCEDCDDGDGLRAPDLDEVTCDDRDNDCDASTPDDDGSCASTCDPWTPAKPGEWSASLLGRPTTQYADAIPQALAALPDGGLAFGIETRERVSYDEDGVPRTVGSGLSEAAVVRTDADGAVTRVVEYISGGLYNYAYVGGVAAAPEDDVYVAAVFASELLVDQGLPRAQVVPSNEGVGGSNSDVFLARMHPDGTYAWQKVVGGVGRDAIYDLHPRSDGGVAWTGALAAAPLVQSDGGAWPAGSYGGRGVVAWSEEGEALWGATLTASRQQDFAWNGTAVAPDDRMFLAGRNQGTFTLTGADGGTLSGPDHPSNGGWIAALGADGEALWVRAIDDRASVGDLVLSGDRLIASGSRSSGTTVTFNAGQPDARTFVAPEGDPRDWFAAWDLDGNLIDVRWDLETSEVDVFPLSGGAFLVFARDLEVGAADCRTKLFGRMIARFGSFDAVYPDQVLPIELIQPVQYALDAGGDAVFGGIAFEGAAVDGVALPLAYRGDETAVIRVRP